MHALRQDGSEQQSPEYKLVVGFNDAPGKVYLVVSGRRYWIASEPLFRACGFSSDKLLSPSQEEQSTPEGRELTTARQVLALLYLHGEGLEIGALHNPSLAPEGSRISFVDYITKEEALKRYPECDAVVSVDILDDGEILNSVLPESQDFLIANHFLEHTENPLGTLRIHASKLKPGGVLFYALPDKRFTFDADRPITPFSHLLNDDKSGPEMSRRGHYLEFAELVDGVRDHIAMDRHATVLMEMDNRIHFHVWDADATKYMFDQACIYLSGKLEISAFISDGEETVTVLRRVS